MSVLTGLTVFSRTREVVKKRKKHFHTDVSMVLKCQPYNRVRGIYVSEENDNKFGIEIAQ